MAYLLKLLSKTERNYKIYDKKMLAVIRGLENWRHLLEDTKFKFEVWTDHKNLEYLKHVLEIKIEKADGFSWRPDCKVRIENNNKNQKLIKGLEEKMKR